MPAITTAQTHTTKTIEQLVEQKDRMWTLRIEVAYKLASAAHPATSGNPSLVHNWGNDAARAIWQNQDRRDNRWLRAYERILHNALCQKYARYK